MQHSFEVEEAVKYGVEKAIILNNLRFWLTKNKANRKNMGDGYYWTYNSAEAFSELFPYITRRSMSRYLNELEDAGIIISSFRCDNKLNRTKSYSMPEFQVDGKYLDYCCVCQNGESIGQIGQCEGQNDQCYTDINNTDINKHIKKDLKDSPAKNSRVEIEEFSLPDGLNLEAWALWNEYRKQTKLKPYKPTKLSAGAVSKKLIDLAGGDINVQMQIVNQSIDMQWSGLFPLKNNQASNGGGDILAKMRQEYLAHPEWHVGDDHVF